MVKTKLSQDSAATSQSDLEKEVTDFFYLNKKVFTAYMLKHYSIDEETIADIYQESFLVLFQDIRSGKLKDLKSATLKSYLFNIGINKAMKYFKEQRKHTYNTSLLQDIYDLINKRLATVNEKDEYLKRLTDIDEHFFTGLTSKASGELSALNVKYYICFYIDMKTEHIAKCFSIEPRRILMTRFHLKMKLQVEKR